MADSKISALPSASTPLAGTEVLPIVQAGATDQVTVANLTAGRAVSVLSLTSTNDSTVNGVTVGKGAGSVSSNTALGVNALSIVTTGGTNTAIGLNTLPKVTISSGSTAIGSSALANNTTNVATLGSITGGTGYNGGAAGGPLVVQSSLSSGSTALTYPTLNITVNASGAITVATIAVNGTGFKDITTVLTVTSAAMVAAGFAAGGSGFSIPVATLSSGGSNNTAIGSGALNGNVTGGQNTAIGQTASGAITTGSNNVIVGQSAFATATTATQNTIVGQAAGNSYNASNSAYFGYRAAVYATTGNNNCGAGSQVFPALLGGGNNTAYGSTAGGVLTTGSNNTYLGFNTQASGVAVTNEMSIGYGTVGSGSNTTTIGNSSTTATIVYGTLNTSGYTVATLPTAGTVGRRTYVTDALAPTFLGVLTGGGAVKTPVFDNGTAWVAG